VIVVIHRTATRFIQAARFGLFQTIIRAYLFHTINKNVACSNVFIAVSTELSIKLCLHQDVLQAKVLLIILEEIRPDEGLE
jgi:hypothetical protein